MLSKFKHFALKLTRITYFPKLSICFNEML